MARTRASSPRARLFLALDPPEEARSEVAEWRDRLTRGRDDLRPVAREALHVTLVFLGWQAEKDVDRIAETAFGAVAVRAPLLVPAGVKPVPPRGPRLFALDLDDEGGRCSELQASAGAALAGAGLWRPERRRFWPHLTLARVKRERRAAPLRADAALPGSFTALELVLYRSTLRPQGARYDPLARNRL